jgi:hypothetical protein
MLRQYGLTGLPFRSCAEIHSHRVQPRQTSASWILLQPPGGGAGHDAGGVGQGSLTITVFVTMRTTTLSGWAQP